MLQIDLSTYSGTTFRERISYARTLENTPPKPTRVAWYGRCSGGASQAEGTLAISGMLITLALRSMMRVNKWTCPLSLLGGNKVHVGLPQTIDSGHGEIIQFKECIHEPDGDRLVFEGIVQPGCGPIFHVHLCQAEGFEVRQGIMAYQVPGLPVQYLAEGEVTVFEKNVPHKFWNAGDTELIINSWAKPAGNLQRYMTILFLSTSKRHSNTPALFDAAYLTIQYKGEFDVLEIPRPVKSLLFPAVYWVGRVFGLYRKYEIDTSRR